MRGYICNIYRRKRLFSLFLVTAFFALLASCTHQTVHIHPDHLSQSQIELLQARLDAEGLRHTIRNNKHPSPDLGNLLIYYPQKGSKKNLAKIYSVLESLDIFVENIMTKKLYKHEYTKGNFGLYLQNSNLRVERVNISEIDFDITLGDYEFYSVECETVLELNEHKSVRFESIPTYEETSEGLSWRKKPDKNASLIIKYANERFQYTLSNFVSSNNNSKTYSTRLTPIDFYRMPFGCLYEGSFIFGG
ncbi:MAG: hypothetical protein ACI93R_002100 [Flavobacteriales bacterium]|jgi:hypothetical protein